MAPVPTPSPAPNPTPPAIPPAVQAALEPMVVKTVEAALASRNAATPPAPAPTVTAARDLQMDPDEGKLYEARMGVVVKHAFLARARALGIDRNSEAPVRAQYERLGEYLLKCKSVGAFASLFGQGAESLPVVQSTELIEFLRARMILMRAGVRRVGGYGGKLVIGRQNTGAIAYWVAEGEPAQKTDIKGGLLELGAHKAMGRVQISNDLMRRGDSNASALVGVDVQTAMALLFDEAGLFGKGNKQPLGVLKAMDQAMKSDIAGSSLQNKIDDLDALPAAVEDKDHDFDDSGFYFMSPKTFWHLRGQRDSGGWVFEGLRDVKNPTHNGFPVLRSSTLRDKKLIGFGLASELYFGAASEMSLALGESGDDFNNDLQTLRVTGYADWQLRHQTAFAAKEKVTY